MADKHANMPGMSGQPKKPEHASTLVKTQKPPKADESAHRDKAKAQPKAR